MASPSPFPLSLLTPHSRKAKSKERQDAQATARQDATLALMKDLPTLLKKLQTDPAQVRSKVWQGVSVRGGR